MTDVQSPGDIYDAAGVLVVAGARMRSGAAAGGVVTSDASGNLSLMPPAYSPEVQPADAGLVAWTADPARNLTTWPANRGAGTLYTWMIRAATAATASNISYFLATAGTGLANCFLGLYDTAGNLLAQSAADQSASMMGGAGTLTAALTAPYTLAAGSLYRVGLVIGTVTTGPSLDSAGAVTSPLLTNLKAPSPTFFRASFFVNGYTALPSSYAPSAVSPNSGLPVFVLT